MKKMKAPCRGIMWVVEGLFFNPFGWSPILVAKTRREARSRKSCYSVTKMRIRKYFSEDVMKLKCAELVNSNGRIIRR